MSDCATLLEVGKCKIAMSPHGSLLNGELFAKCNAVVVREHGVAPNSALPETKGISEPATSAPDPPRPWYIFGSVTDMELVPRAPRGIPRFHSTAQRLRTLPICHTPHTHRLAGRALGSHPEAAVSQHQGKDGACVVGRLMNKLRRSVGAVWSERLLT